MKSIIKDMYRFAATLSAPYPSQTTDKTKPFIDALRQGVQDKLIYNPIFQDAKGKINLNIESISSNIPQLIFQTAYMVDALPSNLTSLPKAIRGLDGILSLSAPPDNWYYGGHFTKEYAQEHWSEIIEGIRLYRETLNSWIEIIGLLKEVGAFVVKGRKPAPVDPNKFQAPIPNTQAVSLVKSKLLEIVEPLKKKLEATLGQQYIETVDKFIKSGQEASYQNIKKFYEKDEFGLMLARSCFENDTIIHDYQNRLKGMAIKDVDQMVERFIIKNISKIAPILTVKNGDVKAKVVYGRLDGMGFSGEIRFDFEDGTGFTVRNKVVMKWTFIGEQFLQFPTTFHDVTFPDGSKKAMLSEEEMHKLWAKYITTL